MANEEKLQQEVDELNEVVKDRDDQIEKLKEEKDNLITALDNIYDLARGAL